MTDRDPFQDPHEEAADAAVARSFSPVAWALIGLVLLGGLMLLWLMPVSPDVNVFTWLGRTVGWPWAGDDSRNGEFFVLPLRMFLVPQAFTLILPLGLGVLVLAGLSGTLRLHRRRAAALVLGYLSSALRLGLPLPVFLRSAAAGEARLPRRRLLSLATHLENGRSIGASLADAAGELPPLTLDRVAAAEQNFTLRESLEPLLDRERRRTSNVAPGVPGRAYVGIVLATMATVTWLVSVFVLPKFAQIFADFKLPVPPLTRTLMTLTNVAAAAPSWEANRAKLFSMNEPARTAASSPSVFVMLLGVASVAATIILGVMILLLLARVTRGLFTSKPGPRLFSWATDRIAWHTPVFGRLTRNQQYAVMADALAESLIVGRPLPEAIDTATLPSLNVVLRRRLRRWHDAVAAGGPAAGSARAANMPPLLCDLLAGSPADAAGAIAFAGRAYAATSGRLAAVLSAVAPVVVTGVLAVFVGLLAMALLGPLISLIDHMPIFPVRR